MNIHINSTYLFTGPSGVQVTTTKNLVDLSVAVQWDEVDDFLPITYIVAWTNKKDDIIHLVTITEESSYTLTGLTLDTVYIITVAASNMCGTGPGYSTTVSFPTGSYHFPIHLAVIIIYH